MDKDPAVYSELQTLRDFIRWGASRMNEAGLFYGHGTDNALDEAAGLVLHALNLSPSIPEALFDTRLTHDEKEAVLELLVERVRTRQPAAYLTHEAWFAGLRFYVDERVLVPRSPIAELIDQGFSPWLQPDKVSRVLDIGAGCGCIAIACAREFLNAVIDAVDVSEGALEVMHINVTEYGLEDQINVIQANVYAGLGEKQYDLIVSNPPYVSTGEMSTMPAEYGHEPEQGLIAGDDGMDIVRKILSGAADYLTEQGILVVEVGNSQLYLKQAYPEVPFLWLEFTRGGDGVFLLTAEQIREYHSLFEERECIA